ncbi:MAG: hypothetical protein AAF267_17175 [Deinococcota bacterium]
MITVANRIYVNPDFADAFETCSSTATNHVKIRSHDLLRMNMHSARTKYP